MKKKKNAYENYCYNMYVHVRAPIHLYIIIWSKPPPRGYNRVRWSKPYARFCRGRGNRDRRGTRFARVSAEPFTAAAAAAGATVDGDYAVR